MVASVTGGLARPLGFALNFKPSTMVREIVNRVVPGFLKPYVPVAMLPQMSKTVGLGSWAAVGGVFAFFLVQVRLRH